MASTLLLILTMTNFAHPNAMNRSVIFEPISQLPISSNGVTFSTLKSSGFAFVADNYWRITSFNNNGFHLYLSLNDSWSFHPSRTTNIQIDIETNSFRSDLVLSFSQLDDTYITTMIDGTSPRNHLIYPQCQISPNKSPLAHGDVKANVDESNGNTIQEKAMDDTEFHLLPNTSSVPAAGSPLTFILQNDPLADTLSFTYKDATTVKVCNYGAMTANVPLDIYMATNELGQTFYVESIAISHSVYGTTSASPSASPSGSPTESRTKSPVRDGAVHEYDPIDKSEENSATVTSTATDPTPIIIGAIAALFCVLICCAVWFLWRKKRKSIEQNEGSIFRTPQQGNKFESEAKKNGSHVAKGYAQDSGFEGNLNNLQTANSILMDDIVDEMENGNATAGGPNVNDLPVTHDDIGEEGGYNNDGAIPRGERPDERMDDQDVQNLIARIDTAGGDSDDESAPHAPQPPQILHANNIDEGNLITRGYEEDGAPAPY